MAMGYEYAGTDEVEESLRAPAELAHSLAVDVERLRLCSPRPVDALLELVAERTRGSSCSDRTPNGCGDGAMQS